MGTMPGNDIVSYPGPFQTFDPKTRILQGNNNDFHLPIGQHERSLWLYERTKQILKQYANNPEPITTN